MLQLKEEQIAPDITVLQVSSKLVLGRDAQKLEWAVDDLARTGGTKIILDLTMLDFVDSTGIGIIMMCSGRVKENGGALRVAGSHGIVDEVLRKTKVNEIVPIYSTRDEAAESLKSS